MSVYRGEFYDALQAMLRVVTEPILTDVFPLTDKHNISARMLRTGLSVSAFALLERYVKSVFDALVTDLAGTRVKYTDFSDTLKKFLVVDSVAGLSNSASFIKDAVLKLNHLETQVGKLANFASNPPIYTAFGFSPSGSNVGHEDIKQGFKAFGVTNAWGKLTGIASIIGSGSLSLENDYIALARSRHVSAHTAANIPTSDLISNLNAAIVIGISVDILGMHLGKAIKNCRTASDLDTSVAGMNFNVRFLDFGTDGKWHERASSASRIVKKYPDREEGKAGMLARRSAIPVVVRNSSSTPIELVV
ncbi:hypothetical protein [Agrobacterium tumefaciens]|uniref:RiboL-PSP-HEPN domain-containing protein n=1 Tax=Agrobacterium tumefaciens TaxID=358 RepID=A0AB36ETF1_AGRTU|nr:hypothetical protein A6U91_02610 [Agrobacterium tumefaciens]